MNLTWRTSSFRDSGLRGPAVTFVLLLCVYAVAKLATGHYQVAQVAYFLPLHTLFEMISVIISALIFSIGWSNSNRQFIGFIYLLAYAFLAVAIFDFAHFMSYTGMPDFLTPNNPEKSINLWLMARAVVAVVLFIVVLRPNISGRTFRHRYLSLFATLTIAASVCYLIIFHQGLLPHTYKAGEGLTAYKITFEYLVAFVHIVTAVLLGFRMKRPLPYNAAMLFQALCIMIASEFFFTRYRDIDDTDIFIGHVFKTVAYVFLYRAIYIEAIELPYNLLAKAKREVQFLADSVPVLIAQFDEGKRFRFINKPYAQLLGFHPLALIGRPCAEVMDSTTFGTMNPYMDRALAGESCSFELAREVPGDAKKILLYRLEPQRVQNRRIDGFIVAISDISELNESIEAARRSNELIHSIIENVPVSIFWKDKTLQYLGCNTLFAKEAGIESPQSIVGKSDFDLVWKEQAEGYRKDDQLVIDSGEARLNIVEPQTRSDGKVKWLMTSKVPLRDRDGEIIGVLGVYSNITEIRDTELELRKLSQAVSQSPHVVFITDAERRIEYVNQAFTEITGFTRTQAIGKTPRLLKSDKTPDSVYKSLYDHLGRGETWRGELINKTESNMEYIASVIISPIRQQDGTITNYLCIQENITLQKQAQQHIEKLAHFDQLTGLPNRELLQHRLRQAIISAHQTNGSFALMFVDLDHFKNINDSLGHNVGDQVLICIADRIKRNSRDEDTVSRVGGDEYILVLPHTDKAGATQVAKKIIEAVSQPMKIEGYELVITPSIGIAFYPDQGLDFATLSKNADTAMYHAKQSGRNGYFCYNPSMQEHTARLLMLESALRHALELNQLEIHYQPQVSIRTGEIVGAEALLRWYHPELGAISPAEFIPVAESGGMINPIGEWVIRKVCEQMRLWFDGGMPPITLAVNLSAVQLRQGHIGETITDILDKFSLPYHCLELELTEAVAMSNYEAAIALMNRLSDKGVQISIDDFGTGYSSLSYLKRFSISRLKIDRSFINDSLNSPEDKAIICAIIKMASTLGIKTLAEGVETEQQLSFLIQEGCDEIQGYYISQSLPARDFEKFFLEERSAVLESITNSHQKE